MQKKYREPRTTAIVLTTAINFAASTEEGTKEEGRRKKEEGRRKKEEGRRKKEEEAIKLMLGVINNVKYSRFLYILYKNKPSFGKKLGLFVFRQNPED